MQFEVTVDGNYVYKTLHVIEKSAAIYRSYGYGLINRDLSKLASDTLDHAKRSLGAVRSILKKYPELASSFANPLIDKDLNYKQDKVTVMGTALHQSSRAEGRKYIDEYIDLLLFHVGYGLADPILQMGTNYGVDKDGRVVLIDIGELVFDKGAAIAAARTRPGGKQTPTIRCLKGCIISSSSQCYLSRTTDGKCLPGLHQKPLKPIG